VLGSRKACSPKRIYNYDSVFRSPPAPIRRLTDVDIGLGMVNLSMGEMPACHNQLRLPGTVSRARRPAVPRCDRPYIYGNYSTALVAVTLPGVPELGTVDKPRQLGIAGYPGLSHGSPQHAFLTMSC
jgi:hypothetical protein